MAEPRRLNKQLALWLGVSRRQADDLIASGKIFVNGFQAELGRRIQDDDKIEMDGKVINRENRLTLLMLNKPVDFTCSRASQKGDKIVYDLLPTEYHSLKLVGRLDKDSSGLILLTNDGDFAYQMTHPKFVKNKTYLVQLDKNLEPLHQQMISDFGVNLADGRSQFLIMRLDASEIIHKNHNLDLSKNIYQITMHEGRNRQIRRTFEALGYKVTKLHRTEFGAYALGDLEIGEWQIIKQSDSSLLN